MTKKSSKPTSSQALKLSLLAGAGAAGVMAQDAAATIISQDLNQQAYSVYFMYGSGAIGTSAVQGSMQGNGFQYDTFWGHRMNGDDQGGGAKVVNGGPLALNTPIDSASAWTGEWFVSNDNPAPDQNGYFGVRFSNGSGGWNYGWVDVQFLGNATRFGMAAVETTLNTPILAGQTSAVPEIDPASAGSAMSLVAGVLAMVEQRRRRRAVPATSAVA